MRGRRRVRCALAVAGALWLSACAGGSPPARSSQPLAPADGEVVPLRFAWPAGLALQVEEHHLRTRQGRALPPVATRYRIRTERMPAGLRIVAHDFGLDADATARLRDPEERAELPRFVNHMLSPTLLVDGAGALVDVEGVSALEAFWRAALGEEPPIDARALVGRSRQEWRLLVSGWAGQDLAIGRLYEAETPGTIGSFGVPIPSRVHFRYRIAGRVACRADDDEPRCVRLEVELHYAPDLTPERIEAVARALSPEGSVRDPLIRAFEFGTRAAIVAEPDGLIPHHASTTSWGEVEIETPTRPDDVLWWSQSDAVERRYAR